MKYFLTILIGLSVLVGPVQAGIGGYGDEADWGSVDFRVLTSDDPNVFPIAIEFTNNYGTDLKAKVDIDTVNWDSEFGPSSYSTGHIIETEPTILYIDLPITEEEEQYDIVVTASVDWEESSQMYNSLMRTEPAAIVDDQLPMLPGEVLKEQVTTYMEEFQAKYGHLSEEEQMKAAVAELQALHPELVPPDIYEEPVYPDESDPQVSTDSEEEYKPSKLIEFLYGPAVPPSSIDYVFTAFVLSGFVLFIFAVIFVIKKLRKK